jgi:hypothetical protein
LWEVFHWQLVTQGCEVAVSRGFERRIAAALSDIGVGSSNNNINNSSVGRLRVHAGVEERHLP